MRKILLSVCLLISFIQLKAQIATLQQLSHIPFPTSTAGVWHYVDSLGNEYALIGAGDGITIVDVTDPVNPNLLFTIPAAQSLWRELKTFGHYCYAGTEGGGGITVIDLSTLPGPVNSHLYTGDGAIAGQLSSSHTVQVFGEYLYIFGSNISQGGAIICSLADPWNPTYVGIYDDHYVHDGYVLNDTLYSAEIYAGQFSVVDVTNKANPVVLATQATPGNFNHNTWFSDNNQYLYTTDELPNTPLGVFDVSDLQNIQLVETYYNDSMPGEEVHNVRVINDFLINPSYGSQITIVDGARPENLIEIARHPTGTYLCWDADPYLPSGNIIVTDTYGGFYVFAPYYVRACYLEGNVTDQVSGSPLSNVSVKILSTTVNVSTVLNGDYKTGYPTPGTFDVEFSKPGYITETVTGVILTTGNLTILDVQLELFTVNGLVEDLDTGLPVPFASVRITNGSVNVETTADAAGTFTLSNITSGMYDITAAKWGYKSGCISSNLGSGGQVTVLVEQGLYDDFTFDFGWTVTGNASTGMWERGEPIGTVFTTTQANPDFDVTNDCSDRCYVTGNGGGMANDDDVDNGNTILTSPVLNLTGYTDPYLNYERWFYEQFSGNPNANDTLYINISNGSTTEVVDIVTGPSPTNSSWVPASIRILDFITATSNMNIIVEISDKPGTGNPLECAFDRFEITEGPTGTHEPTFGSVGVFPNPFNNLIGVTLPVGAIGNSVEITLTDITGKTVLKTMTNGVNEISLDGSKLMQGIYLLHVVSSGSHFKPVKIIKGN